MTNLPSLFLTIGDIIEATGGILLQGRSEQTILGVSTDTRTIETGNLFIPLMGPNFNGHDFLTKAVTGGAGAFLTGKTCRSDVPVFPGGIAWIEVDDTLRALGDIAHYWRKRMNCRVMAITGSAGKTTTKEMIASICSLNQKILKTEGNFNNLVGLPLTLLGLQEGIDLAILELGTNAPGEIECLTRLAEPDIGLITNIGPAHLEGLGTISAVREEKGQLLAVMNHQGVAVFNLDDPEIDILQKRWRGDRITFSLSAPADITAENIRPVETWKTAFILNIRGIREDVVLSVPGRHNIRNALAAAAAAMAAGCEPALISRGLHAVRPVSGRMEIETLPNGAHLIHDAYNANPLSVAEALKTLVDISGNHQRIVFLGDMLELGAEAKRFHQELGGQLGRADIHRLFLKGEFSRITAEAAVVAGMDRGRIFFFNEPTDILPMLQDVVNGGNWILLKGSRKMNLNELIPDIRRLGDQELQKRNH
jgi:UDP-N-acetylmuramoyl-tripeptide--D-alanyl-D-alanine ligase